MTLADPTGGAGYIFGQSLPAAHMTTIATNQPKAVDGNGGGTWTPSASIILNGTGALQLGAKLKYTSRTVSRAQPLVMSALTANWDWAAAAVGTVWQNATTNTICVHEFTKLAHGAVLDGITVFYQGGPGHMGVPAVMPSFQLVRISTSNVYTAIGAAFNATVPNAAAFEAVHSASISGLAHTISLDGRRYGLLVTAETGAFSLANGKYLFANVDMTVTEQAEV